MKDYAGLGLAFAILGFAITACAPSLTMTYYTSPPLATLLYKGKYQGVTPVTLTYNIREEDRSRGYVYLGDYTVLWSSGAQATESVTANITQNGFSQTHTFIRPDVPGLDYDWQVYSDMLKAEYDEYRWNMLMKAARRDQSFHCTSRSSYNGEVRTSCY